jgi:hypothetical protein
MIQFRFQEDRCFAHLFALIAKVRDLVLILAFSTMGLGHQESLGNSSNLYNREGIGMRIGHNMQDR